MYRNSCCLVYTLREDFTEHYEPEFCFNNYGI